MFYEFRVLSLTLSLSCLQGSSAEWLKLKGDDVGNQPSVSTEANPGLQLLPGSRSGSASWLEPGGVFWMFGGIGYDSSYTDSSHPLNDLWWYNVSNKQWQLAHSGQIANQQLNGTRAVPKPRRGAVVCGVPNILLVIFGGESYHREKLYDTWLYRIQNGSWLPLLDAMDNPSHPPARSDAATWCMNDRIVMYGGAGRNGELLNDMWQFSLRTLEWSVLRQHSGDSNDADKPLLPHSRMGASTWIHNGSLVMFGGSTSTSEPTELYMQSTDTLLSDLWQYNIASSTWYLLHANKDSGDENALKYPRGRLLAGSSAYQDQLSLFGGYGLNTKGERDFLNDLWHYDWITKMWKSEAMNSSNTGRPTPRCDGTMWFSRDVVYIFGGFGFDKEDHVSFLNDLYVHVNQNSTLLQFLPATKTYLKQFIRELPPSVIFAICFGTFGGVVLIFGTMFCLKKMIAFPSHGPMKLRKYNRKNVKYSKVEDDITMDM